MPQPVATATLATIAGIAEGRDIDSGLTIIPVAPGADESDASGKYRQKRDYCDCLMLSPFDSETAQRNANDFLGSTRVCDEELRTVDMPSNERLGWPDQTCAPHKRATGCPDVDF